MEDSFFHQGNAFCYSDMKKYYCLLEDELEDEKFEFRQILNVFSNIQKCT